MDLLVPQLVQHWSASATAAALDKSKRDEDEARAEEIELSQLADLIVAARSVY